MIIHPKTTADQSTIEELNEKYSGILSYHDGRPVIVTSSKIKKLEDEDQQNVEASYSFDSDIQLASRHYIAQKRQINVSGLPLGGETNQTYAIAGPCSVESEEQILNTAQFLYEKGVKILRAGCYKPRTSPYTFQGMGEEGLKLLDHVRKKYGFKIITEVKDATHVDKVIEYADIVQVGTKAMYDQGILNACAQSDRPVLIKRGFAATLQEFVQAAEFVMSGGNDQVILCERGIRTFENKTRFTLDLCGVAFLKAETNLPVVVDPSHAMGKAYGVPDLTRASLAMGVEGLLIEVHPNPKEALSDSAQQLNFDQFSELYDSLKHLAPATGYSLA